MNLKIQEMLHIFGQNKVGRKLYNTKALRVIILSKEIKKNILESLQTLKK